MADKKPKRPGKWERAARREFEEMDPEWQQDWADLHARTVGR